jgi:hypothetical protein
MGVLLFKIDFDFVVSFDFVDVSGAAFLSGAGTDFDLCGFFDN